MKEKLIQYVDLLFAGVADSDDMKQEILQNTLDRYDDLIAQGKQPEAAYRLAISGIGDINEILGTIPQSSRTAAHYVSHEDAPAETENIHNKKLRALGIALYILCFIPLFLFSDIGLETLGLCLTVCLVAVATYIMIITGKKEKDDEEEKDDQPSTPQQELKQSIGKLAGALTLAIYLIVSFATGAWYITWIIFPISGCVKGLVNAILDLKEARKHEN